MHTAAVSAAEFEVEHQSIGARHARDGIVAEAAFLHGYAIQIVAQVPPEDAHAVLQIGAECVSSDSEIVAVRMARPMLRLCCVGL